MCFEKTKQKKNINTTGPNVFTILGDKSVYVVCNTFRLDAESAVRSKGGQGILANLHLRNGH